MSSPGPATPEINAKNIAEAIALVPVEHRELFKEIVVTLATTQAEINKALIDLRNGQAERDSVFRILSLCSVFLLALAYFVPRPTWPLSIRQFRRPPYPFPEQLG